MQAHIIAQPDMVSALASRLYDRLSLCEQHMPDIRSLIAETLSQPKIRQCLSTDLYAVYERDSACTSLLVPFLYFKGYNALQNYRVSHHLWHNGKQKLALLLQSLGSEVYAIDIHPAARIGCGVMMDHGSAIVIGETAVVGDQVSIMQGVTLGGTGKEEGERHPKVHSGVLISAGAIILGNITIGTGAKIAAGSVVLKDVPPHTTVAGVPAVPVGASKSDAPALEMDHEL